MNAAIARIGRSIAVIDSSPAGTSSGLRTLGIVISADGTVLTAASAVQNDSTVLVELPGTGVVSVGHVICVDSASGLALIRVATDVAQQPLTFSAAAMTAPSFAVAVTSSGSAGDAPQFSLGSLESLNVRVATSSGTLMNVDTTDLSAAANPPGTPAGPVTAELLAHNSIQHGWIGVAGISVKTAKHQTRGVLVRGVQAGSAASAAGLAKGDTIVALDGQRLYTMSQLQGRLYVLGAGAQVRLTVIRNGLRRNVIVDLSLHQNLVAAAR